MPLILVNRIPRKVDTSYIVANDLSGAKLAVEYLIGLGHQRIGFIGGSKDLIPSRERLQGYKKVLKAHALRLYKEITSYADSAVEAGYHVMKRYLKLSNLPTAVFAADDMIALGAIEAIEEQGEEPLS
ncbi:MAG: substrate-binding domain-containing protein [Candidatus Bipolaricaulia bacterium]